MTSAVARDEAAGDRTGFEPSTTARHAVLAPVRHGMGNEEFEDEWLCAVEIDGLSRSKSFVGFPADDLGGTLAELYRLAAEAAINQPSARSDGA